MVIFWYNFSSLYKMCAIWNLFLIICKAICLKICIFGLITTTLNVQFDPSYVCMYLYAVKHRWWKRPNWYKILKYFHIPCLMLHSMLGRCHCQSHNTRKYRYSKTCPDSSWSLIRSCFLCPFVCEARSRMRPILAGPLPRKSCSFFALWLRWRKREKW